MGAITTVPCMKNILQRIKRSLLTYIDDMESENIRLQTKRLVRHTIRSNAKRSAH